MSYPQCKYIFHNPQIGQNEQCCKNVSPRWSRLYCAKHALHDPRVQWYWPQCGNPDSVAHRKNTTLYAFLTEVICIIEMMPYYGWPMNKYYVKDFLAYHPFIIGPLCQYCLKHNDGNYIPKYKFEFKSNQTKPRAPLYKSNLPTDTQVFIFKSDQTESLYKSDLQTDNQVFIFKSDQTEPRAPLYKSNLPTDTQVFIFKSDQTEPLYKSDLQTDNQVFIFKSDQTEPRAPIIYNDYIFSADELSCIKSTADHLSINLGSMTELDVCNAFIRTGDTKHCDVLWAYLDAIH